MDAAEKGLTGSLANGARADAGAVDGPRW